MPWAPSWCFFASLIIIVIGNISSFVSEIAVVTKLDCVTASGGGVVVLLGKESKESRIGEEEGIIGGRGGVDITTFSILPLGCVGFGE